MINFEMKCLEITKYAKKLLWSNVCKSPLFWIGNNKKVLYKKELQTTKSIL